MHIKLMLTALNKIALCCSLGLHFEFSFGVSSAAASSCFFFSSAAMFVVERAT
jgi:hypothetical protein